MKQFIINENDSGQRLDKFLTKAAPTMPKSIMYKAIRTKNIKINRKRAEISTKLITGDIVDVYVNDEFLITADNPLVFLSVSDSLDIIYEDDNILLVNKPVGLVVHEDESNSPDTLINRVLHYLYNQKIYNPSDENSFVPSLCNRIDRNTSGIVICAKNAQTLRIINLKIKDREILKKYLALIFGVPKEKHNTVTAFLRKDTNKKQVEIFNKPIQNGLKIITEYRVLENDNKFSLIEVTLHTGRTHQIRAHMAYIGHPLVGETKYGTAQMNKGLPFKYQALCSYSLTFSFATDAEHLNYLKDKTFTLKNRPFDISNLYDKN